MLKTHKILLLPVPLIMFCHTCLFSATSAYSDTTKRKLEAATVSAIVKEKSIAITKTELDSAMLSHSVNSSMASLLTRETPVFVKSYGMGSMATVSFRGTSPSHTQVKWNGLDINNPMLGQVDFSQIPVWMIDKAEVLHGGSSLAQGSGALGGSVHLYSRASAKPQKPTFSIIQRTASFGNLATMVSASAGNPTIASVVRCFYEEAGNNFKFNNTAVLPNRPDQQKNAEYNRKGISADFVVKASAKDKIEQSIWHLGSSRNLPAIMSYEGPGREEYQKESDTRYSAAWQRVQSRYRHTLASGFSFTKMDYLLANKTGMGIVINIDSRSKAFSYQNSYKMQLVLSGKFKLFSDANLNFYKVETLNHLTEEGYNASRVNLGGSVSIHYGGKGAFGGFVLLRQEFTDGRLLPPMPSAGAELLLDGSGTKIGINITRNYHMPTLNDLYWLPGGNPNLKPERGYTADISFVSDGSWWSASTTAYISHINDWIIWRPGEFRYWSAENLREVLARGAEINLKATYLTQIGVLIEPRANWAYTRTTNQNPLATSETENIKTIKKAQLIYIPVHKGNLFFRSSYHGFSFQWHCAYTSERFTTSSNQPTRHKLPGYTLHNISFQKKLRVVTFMLEIENIFNTNYQAILWRAMPGRNYYFTARLDL